MLGKLTLLSLLPIVLGQYDYGTTTSTSSSGASSTATATGSSSGSVQTVAVAQNGLTFSPNSLTVMPGDMVVFQFFSAGHSVTEGEFNNPCQPSNSSALNSGFSTGGSGPNSFFTVEVNSTDPIWFYCAQVGHCQAGMVGVINPPSGQTVADFQAAAKNAGSSSMPPTVQGGSFGTPPAAASSGSNSSASASPSTKSLASMIRGDLRAPAIAGVMCIAFAWYLS